MPVKLSARDKKFLNGGCGEAAEIAMRIVVRMADVLGADELMDVSQAHIDGCGLLSEASLDFAEMLARKGGKVCIPTTLNMGPLDLQKWEDFGIDEDFAAKAIRQGKAYTDMGCIPTWTCAPYQSYLTPRFAQQIAWGESNAVAYANSVLGARTNRYADYMDICAAITGRVPKCGLHLKANRKGQVLFRLVDIDEEAMETNAFYVVLGHFVGKAAGKSIAVIDGVPPNATSDQLKAFYAAAASSGAVALCHIVGVTPEAATVEDAFCGDEPQRVIGICAADLDESLADLSTAGESADIDAVVLGCPHFSFEEFRELAELIQGELDKGNSLCEGVRFIVISSETSHALLQRSEFVKVLEEFGVEITLDTCVFHTPMISKDAKVIMTNSGKCSWYTPGELGCDVAFGTMADCVASAVAGRVCRKELLWNVS